jgi:hypothetical protein
VIAIAKEINCLACKRKTLNIRVRNKFVFSTSDNNKKEGDK